MVLHGHMTLVHLLIHTQLGIIIIPVLLYRITKFASIILEGNHNNKDNNNQQHNDSRHGSAHNNSSEISRIWCMGVQVST